MRGVWPEPDARFAREPGLERIPPIIEQGKGADHDALICAR
jgi:hypothetical protein